MWRGLGATHGDIVVFVDADLRSFTSSYVLGLLGPLLADPSVLKIGHNVKYVRQHGADVSQNRLALVREDDFVELFEKVFLQTFEQIEYIPIIEIKSSAIDVNPFGQLAHSDILHLFMLHQFNQPLTEQLFCASNPMILFFLRSVFRFHFFL